MHSGQSSPVCSARSQLYGPPGCCSCRTRTAGAREAPLPHGLPCGIAGRGPCCTLVRRSPVTGGSASCSRIRTPSTGRNRAASVSLSTQIVRKKYCELRVEPRFVLANEIVRLLEGPTSAPIASPQYEGAPNLATAKDKRNAQAFYIAYSPIFQTGALL